MKRIQRKLWTLIFIPLTLGLVAMGLSSSHLTKLVKGWGSNFHSLNPTNSQGDLMDKLKAIIKEQPEEKKSYYPKMEQLDEFYIITLLPEQLEVALVRGELNQDGVNGGFFDPNLRPLGVVIIQGEQVADRVSYRPPRSVLVLDQGRAEIIPRVEQARDLGPVEFALGAGPLLLPQIGHEEGFLTDVMNSARSRTAVGITEDNLVKLVSTARNTTIQELAAFMEAIGCVQAMNLDGGGSVSLNWQGESLLKGRAISTALVIKNNTEKKDN